MVAMFWIHDFEQGIESKIFNFERDWRDLSLAEVSPNNEKEFLRYSDFEFFHTSIWFP